MRKVLAWVLLLTLCLGLFAGCNTQEPETTETPTTEPTVEVDPNGAANALAYVKTMYKNAGEKTPKDFTRIGVVPVGETKYEIVWTADVSEDLVKIVVGENGMVTVDVNEACEQDTPYTLTATVTGSDGKTHSYSWNHLLPAAMSVEQILKDAYALADGEVLPYEVTLTGKIKSIDTAYSADYQNITVTIEVEGFEDMPVQCYRLKGEGAENLSVGNIITVTGTIKNYKGTIEFDAGCVLDAVETGEAVEAPTDPFEIIDQAYELARGDSLPYPVTLTGIITSVDTPYDPNYKNITVTIAVPGRLNKPIMCYRMKGDDLEKLKTSDEITVSGTIVNYEGTREFNAGCQLISVVPGSGHTQPSDPVKVVQEAYALPLAGNLLYDAELTGTITKINTKYSSSYGNITVTFVVDGAEDMPIQCYRMTGDKTKLAALKVGDTITVKGLIKNYYSFSSNTSTIQYDKPVLLDCVLNDAPQTPEYTAMMPVSDVKPGVAYKFGLQQNSVSGKPFYMITGEMDYYYFETVTDASMAVDVYVEQTNGGYYIYTQKGSTKQYINIVVSGTYYNVKYESAPSNVWTLNTQYKYVMTTASDGTDVYLGTYGQNTTVGASKTSYISNTSTIGVSQFCAWFLEVDPNGGSGSDEPGTTLVPTLVEKPEVGTAYKFGMVQENLDNKIYYITGEMSSYYMATTEDAASAADVYLEQTSGGYYLYTTAGGKQYINMVVSGTHVNAKFEATASTVYTYNAEKQTVTAVIDGADYWHGTRNDNTYTTVGPVKVEYDGFYCQFYTLTEGTVTPEPGTSTVVDTPVVGTAYKFGMVQKNLDNKVFYITGEMSNYYMGTTEDAASAADVYLEQTSGGYYLYTTAGGKQYINMVVSGTYVNAKFEDTASTVYTYNTEKKTVTAMVNGSEYWHGTRNDNTYTTVGPVKVEYDGFYCQFYTSSGSTGGGTVTPEPEKPTTSGTATLLTEKPAHGDVIVIYNSNKAMGAASGNKMSAVDATVSGTSLGVTDTMLQLTVAVDGENYMFLSDGKYLTSGETGNSMSLADTLTDCGKWTLEAADTGSWYIKNVGANYNGNYNQAMEYYSGFTTYGLKTTDIYKMQLFKIEESTAAAEATLLTSAPVNGDIIIVYNSNKAMGAASGNKMSAVDATVSGSKLAVADNMLQLTVVVDGQNYMFLSGGKYLTSGETGNSMSLADTLTDCGKWTLEAADTGSWYIKNVGANYNGNYNQAMEYYSGFTTYGLKTTDIYKMQLYKVGAGGSTTPPVTPEPEPEQPAVTGTKYTFADYSKGVSTVGAAGEVHELDSNVTVTVYNKAFFTTQLRLYDVSDSNYKDSHAILSFKKAVSKLVLNAGHYDSSLRIWVSNDGKSWTEIDTVTVSSAYADLTVDLGGDYTYVKLQAGGKQVRIQYFIVDFKKD